MFTEMYKMIDELHEAVQSPCFVAVRYMNSIDALIASFEEFQKSVGSAVVVVTKTLDL